MTEIIENIFQLDSVLQFSYNRKKEDYIRVLPVTGTNLNNQGQINFELNNQQNYISLSDSFLTCEFTITRLNGTALGADNITLENNFFPRCFNQMILKIGGREIENISAEPGIASTIANFIMSSEIYNRKYGQISSWIPDTNKGDTNLTVYNYNAGYCFRKEIYNDKKKFTIMFPLKYLFGFTEYTKILSNIKISLALGRKDTASISEEIFYGAVKTAAVVGGAAAVYYDAKLQFDSLEWHIPSISPSLEVEEIITKRLTTNKPIDVVFMKRNTNQISVPTGSNYSWSLGNYTNSIRFIFVAFKLTGAPSTGTNNVLFTTHDGTDKITSLRVQLNQTYYPIDRMQMDFLNGKVLEPYLAYINCCQMFGNEPQLSVQEFRDLYPIFCFDVSAQSKNLKDNGIYVNLHIEKSPALTLQGYALLLEDCQYKIDVNDGAMVRIQ